MNELLHASLEGLHHNGGAHVALTQTDVTIQEYHTVRQQILNTQADEIQAAIVSIQARYQDTLWQLEQEYGMYVHMITPTGGNS